MSPPDAATVQAASAAIVALLTLVLAVVAAKALLAANKQAEASGKQAEASAKQAEISAIVVDEMRRERHLSALPLLSITLNPLNTSEVNRILSVVYLHNASTTPALNVRIHFREAWDRYKPQEHRVVIAPAVPVVGPGERINLPVDLSRFPRADPPRAILTNWVAIFVEFEGLLGAKITEEWYWEPLDWEGANEPVPGHGEKLILYRVSGTSGAQRDVEDIAWQRGEYP